MVATNVLFYTSRASTAYTTYLIPGRQYVKTLPKGSAFRIKEIAKYQGQIWVKSGLGHWYQFTSDLFADASCHVGSRVNLSPYYVNPTMGLPPAGSICVAYKSEYAYHPRHVQPVP